MLASQYGHTEALALLLANGGNGANKNVDVNAADKVTNNCLLQVMNSTEIPLKIIRFSHILCF